VISTHDDAIDAIDAIDGIDAFGRRSRDGTVDVAREDARGRTRDDGDDVPEIGRDVIQERWMAVAGVRQGDGTDEWERRKGWARGEEGVRALGSDAARDDDGKGGRGDDDGGGGGRTRRGARGRGEGRERERDDEKNARGGF